MSGRAFLDTNVFVYAQTGAEKILAKTAKDLIQRLVVEQAAVISYQVIQEFFNVALTKARPRLDIVACQIYLADIFMQMEMVPSSAAVVMRGLDVKEHYQFSWYDSLIVAAALEAKCDVLYTEDLQHGQQIGEMTIVNPFL